MGPDHPELNFKSPLVKKEWCYCVAATGGKPGEAGDTTRGPFLTHGAKKTLLCQCICSRCCCLWFRILNRKNVILTKPTCQWQPRSACSCTLLHVVIKVFSSAFGKKNKEKTLVIFQKSRRGGKTEGKERDRGFGEKDTRMGAQMRKCLLIVPAGGLDFGLGYNFNFFFSERRRPLPLISTSFDASGSAASSPSPPSAATAASPSAATAAGAAATAGQGQHAQEVARVKHPIQIQGP